MVVVVGGGGAAEVTGDVVGQGGRGAAESVLASAVRTGR